MDGFGICAYMHVPQGMNPNDWDLTFPLVLWGQHLSLLRVKFCMLFNQTLHSLQSIAEGQRLHLDTDLSCSTPTVPNTCDARDGQVESVWGPVPACLIAQKSNPQTPFLGLAANWTQVQTVQSRKANKSKPQLLMTQENKETAKPLPGWQWGMMNWWNHWRKWDVDRTRECHSADSSQWFCHLQP